MAELRPHDTELWDEMVTEVLGEEWLTEDSFDQLVAMVEYNGDPDAARREIEGVLD